MKRIIPGVVLSVLLLSIPAIAIASPSPAIGADTQQATAGCIFANTEDSYMIGETILANTTEYLERANIGNCMSTGDSDTTSYGQYTDADDNGVCDNYESRADSQNNICVLGQGKHCGLGFQDTDGNGICDNYESGSCSRAGASGGHGRHCQRWRN